MKFKTPIPKTPDLWIKEIAEAYNDAYDTLPFGILVGQEILPEDLFHLGPAVCLKFRGIKQSKSNLNKATEAALSSYVATKEIVGELFDIPQMSFAFSYLASHFGLELIDDLLSTKILDYIENNIDQIIELTNKD
ncbi:MAG: hypothetical protein JXR70_18945 [Spirochaetales bacterium]|nr:hypothetical protein [Spirochaetales bacterium]